jgi:hypothetical protein
MHRAESNEYQVLPNRTGHTLPSAPHIHHASDNAHCATIPDRLFFRLPKVTAATLPTQHRTQRASNTHVEAT